MRNTRGRRCRHFNPRSPHGERHISFSSICQEGENINPRSPHGERPFRGWTRKFLQRISIHAPRTGSDAGHGFQLPRALAFQSTLPARGATIILALKVSARINFNPRSPHGERPVVRRRRVNVGVISIHAPRTGSDVDFQRGVRRSGFQSTLPARGATKNARPARNERIISIHAPRTGSDRTPRSGWPPPCNFNPRSPHGERLYHCRARSPTAYFNPRSPHGERLHE